MGCDCPPRPLGGCMPHPRVGKAGPVWSSYRNPMPRSYDGPLPETQGNVDGARTMDGRGTVPFLKIFPYHVQPSHRYEWRHPADTCLDVRSCLDWGYERMAFTKKTTESLEALLRDCEQFRTQNPSLLLDDDSKCLTQLRETATRVITRAWRERTYWRILDQLSRLDWDNLRARYLQFFLCSLDAATSSWSPLVPFVCTIISEVAKERRNYAAWRDAVEGGRLAVTSAPPSRRWHRMLLKVSKHAHNVPMYRGRSLAWPFARIMRVLEETHARIHEQHQMGTFLTAALMHRVHPLEAGLILARDTVLDYRAPPGHNWLELEAIRAAVSRHASQLLYRAVVSCAGVPLALHFRREDDVGETCPPCNSLLVESVVTARDWQAVPLIRARYRRLVQAQRVRVEDRVAATVYQYTAGHEDVVSRAHVEAAWEDGLRQYLGCHGGPPWPHDELAELIHADPAHHGLTPLGMYYNHGDRNVAARWESETQSSSYASTCWGGYEGLPVMGLDYGHEVVPKREDSAAEDDDDDRRPLSPLPRLRSRPVGEAAMHTWLDGVEPGRAEACIPARRPWDGWDESDGDDCWPGWGRVYDADGEGGLDDDGWCGSEDSSGEGGNRGRRRRRDGEPGEGGREDDDGGDGEERSGEDAAPDGVDKEAEEGD